MNHGSFQPIAVHAPAGTFINARPPVACGGSVEVKALLDALIAAALIQAVPEKMVGDLKGTGNHVYIAGNHAPSHGKRMYLFYEYPAGGTGATRRGDGSHATRTYTEGDFNTIGSAEVIESEMPLRIEETAVREDSHGNGTFRGGCGMRRDIRVLGTHARCSRSFPTRTSSHPTASAGRTPAKAIASPCARRKRCRRRPFPVRSAASRCKHGDLVRIETSGGGGLGDPLERDAALVAEDVRLGYS